MNVLFLFYLLKNRSYSDAEIMEIKKFEMYRDGVQLNWIQIKEFSVLMNVLGVIPKVDYIVVILKEIIVI